MDERYLWSLVWPPESFLSSSWVSNSELQGGSILTCLETDKHFPPVISHSFTFPCEPPKAPEHGSLSPLVSPYAVLSACKVSFPPLLPALSLCSVSCMACSSLSHMLHVTLAVIIVRNLFYLPIRMQTPRNQKLTVSLPYLGQAEHMVSTKIFIEFITQYCNF